MLKDLCIPVSPEELEKEFSKMDGDHNGEVSFDEFKKWYVEFPSPLHLTDHGTNSFLWMLMTRHNDHGEGITKINRFARLKMKVPLMILSLPESLQCCVFERVREMLHV